MLPGVSEMVQDCTEEGVVGSVGEYARKKSVKRKRCLQSSKSSTPGVYDCQTIIRRKSARGAIYVFLTVLLSYERHPVIANDTRFVAAVVKFKYGNQNYFDCKVQGRENTRFRKHMMPGKCGPEKL